MIKNAVTLAENLMSKGYDVVSGGTDTHLVLVDLRKHMFSGAKREKILELISIAVNKITGEK